MDSLAYVSGRPPAGCPSGGRAAAAPLPPDGGRADPFDSGYALAQGRLFGVRPDASVVSHMTAVAPLGMTPLWGGPNPPACPLSFAPDRLAGREQAATAQALQTAMSFGFGSITGAIVAGALLDHIGTNGWCWWAAVLLLGNRVV